MTRVAFAVSESPASEQRETSFTSPCIPTLLPSILSCPVRPITTAAVPLGPLLFYCPPCWSTSSFCTSCFIIVSVQSVLPDAHRLYRLASHSTRRVISSQPFLDTTYITATSYHRSKEGDPLVATGCRLTPATTTHIPATVSRPRPESSQVESSRVA